MSKYVMVTGTHLAMAYLSTILMTVAGAFVLMHALDLQIVKKQNLVKTNNKPLPVAASRVCFEGTLFVKSTSVDSSGTLLNVVLESKTK